MDELDHYLLTAPTGHGYMHCYVMTNDRKKVMAAASQMLDTIAEKDPSPVNVILDTLLNPDGVKVVRDRINRDFPEAAAMLKTATDFHYSAWMDMPSDSPDNAQLLELH